MSVLEGGGVQGLDGEGCGRGREDGETCDAADGEDLVGARGEVRVRGGWWNCRGLEGKEASRWICSEERAFLSAVGGVDANSICQKLGW